IARVVFAPRRTTAKPSPHDHPDQPTGPALLAALRGLVLPTWSSSIRISSPNALMPSFPFSTSWRAWQPSNPKLALDSPDLRSPRPLVRTRDRSAVFAPAAPSRCGSPSERSHAMHRPDAKRLPEERRREIFLALVEAQDKDLGVPQSREAVARRFDLSVEEVRQIEREGLDASWPPL